ncbi:hypothetical protein [Mesorhizobium carmichaelinearum]|uniref:hypothetical protein n=1 Tax=Mesorhizobium carmichaelinearum TaxID=1208188 RepID=UPI001FCEFC4F|nr:hypothetical protein [Mesorhizobium carmichaelinearum]
MFARQMPDVKHHMLVVDNALPVGHISELGRDVELIGGSNSDWEFSAWDSGIDHIGERLHEYDLVHLATSAFREFTPDHLKLIDSRVVGFLQSLQAALGHIDFYNEPVSLLGIQSQAWLRSSFILMPPKHLKALGSLVSVSSDSPIFSGNPRAPFRDDAPVSEVYKRLLLRWLTGDGTGQGVAWHSRFDLTREALPFFENKARAILNEQMLTNRLLANGCEIVDATWLAGKARRRRSGSRGDIPDWRVQITPRIGPDLAITLSRHKG